MWESIQREPQGLRMTLRGDSEDGMVGVANRFPIRGDFEITASYEIVNSETPQVGYGAGPGIYIKMLSSDDNAAVLARLIRVPEGNVLSATSQRTVLTVLVGINPLLQKQTRRSASYGWSEPVTR